MIEGVPNMVQITKKDFNNLRKELGLAFVGLGEYSATLEDPDVCQKHLSKMHEIIKKYNGNNKEE